jgi:hypothetical protein
VKALPKNEVALFFYLWTKESQMKFKVKNEKIAAQFGVKKNAIVEVPDQQADKWKRLEWGTEYIAKEEKNEFETKEFKTEIETKDDATN